VRTVRLSQVISPFGVGAVLDVDGESLMGVDISEWPYERTARVECRRLEDRLGVQELRSPPSVPARPSTRTPGIYYQRFPRWLFCQDCRRMHRRLGHEEDGGAPKCLQCGAKLVPMRFIVVCATKGHAMDVPWDRWAHSEPRDEEQSRCREPVLSFETRRGGSEGLSGLVVRCVTCNAGRDLGDLTVRDSLKRIGVTCLGLQPWQRGAKACQERLEVLQRGATNVTMAETTTALDIPEPAGRLDEIEARIRQHRNFEDLRSAPEGPRAAVFRELIAEDVGVDEAVVRAAVAAEPGVTEAIGQARTALLSDEWRAFMEATQAAEEPIGTPNFVVTASTLLTQEGSARPSEQALDALVDRVLLVNRLREIRVLHGFRRYALDADLVDVDLGPRGRQRWLPAVESFGEGVFLALDQRQLRQWEQDDRVQARAAILEAQRRKSAIGSRFFEATPKAILIHTLAHLLMRRLAFSCGYSAASLRERVYAASTPESEAGLLIYTAAGDAEGTLGGLVRQGEPPRLTRTILGALEEASWCSADPLCRESRGQGLDRLNLAACHACSLTAETSCERSNALLDRVLVIGHDKTPGFFQGVLDALREETSAQASDTA
jgi:hypothetical protein